MRTLRRISRAGTLARLVRTVRHLTPGQIYWRIRYRFPVPETAWSEVTRRVPMDGWCAPVPREACVDPVRGVATFMNAERPVSSASSWNDPSTPKLWLYHLHYFEDLDGQRRRHGSGAVLAWMRRWIDENPHGAGNGWEPYPASRRVVAWIKAALGGLPLDGTILGSLARQAGRVEARLEFHLLANHLFVNAKALVFAGAFFSGRDADRCLARGVRLLLRELRVQALPDGGHFERSVMYHASFLEDLLDLANLCRAFRGVPLLGRIEPVILRTAVASMGWLVRMTCPDGTYPRFNDSTGGEVPTLDELLAYAGRLGFPAMAITPGAAEHLESSGFARISAGGWTAFADIGSVSPSFQPGHAHAGTLSADLYDGTRCLVCGSGVSTYEIGEVREFERSTAARWAVVVGGENSSEVWAGFRVGRRATVHHARVWEDDGTSSVEAWHDGYAHLAGRPRTGRRIDVSAQGVTVVESVIGEGEHCVVGRITLHPRVAPSEDEVGRIVLRDDDGAAYELLADPPVAFAREAGWFAPEFGVRQLRQVLVWRVEGALPIAVRFRLKRLWAPGRPPPAGPLGGDPASR